MTTPLIIATRGLLASEGDDGEADVTITATVVDEVITATITEELITATVIEEE